MYVHGLSGPLLANMFTNKTPAEIAPRFQEPLVPADGGLVADTNVGPQSITARNEATSFKPTVRQRMDGTIRTLVVGALLNAGCAENARRAAFDKAVDHAPWTILFMLLGVFGLGALMSILGSRKKTD